MEPGQRETRQPPDRQTGRQSDEPTGGPGGDLPPDLRTAIQRGARLGELDTGEELEHLASGNDVRSDYALRLTRKVLIPLAAVLTVFSFLYAWSVLGIGLFGSFLIAIVVWFVGLFVLGVFASAILRVLALRGDT